MRIVLLFITFITYAIGGGPAAPQSAAGNAGTVQVTVTDPSGAIFPGANVELENRVTQYDQKATTDQNGVARFNNVPPNPYRMMVTASGFQGHVEDLNVRTSVPIDITVALELAKANTAVEVHASADMVESAPTAHTTSISNCSRSCRRMILRRGSAV